MGAGGEKFEASKYFFGDENILYLIACVVVTYCLSRLRIVHLKKKMDLQPYMLAYVCSAST